MTREEFLAFEGASRDSIDVKRCYIDMVGDLVAGVLLSQIIYWHLPGENGNLRLRVEIEGELWLAKRREDWWEECRISKKQFDRAAEVLEAAGLIITIVKRFAGNPTKHVRINWPVFLEKLASTTAGKNEIPQRGITKLRKGKEQSLPKQEQQESHQGHIVLPESAIPLQTENPTETTPKNTQRTKHPQDVLTSFTERGGDWTRLPDHERTPWRQHAQEQLADLLPHMRPERQEQAIDIRAEHLYTESKKAPGLA